MDINLMDALGDEDTDFAKAGVFTGLLFYPTLKKFSRRRSTLERME